jgi:type I restriction enzyme, S subunit
MSEWFETRIGDVAVINKNNLSKDYPFEEIEYIDVSSVDKGTLLGTQILNLREAPSRAKRIVNKNDILISTVRPNLEHYYYVKNCKENTVASTGYAVITTKGINPYFLYCLLTRKSYTNYLTLIADGHTSTFPAFNPDVIEDTFLPIPDISEQNKIASILSTLDSKIDLLRKQNQTLENIAQTLFKRWFIEFEFPDNDGKPFKSSGGKMAESELGEIPDGWRVGNIGSLEIVVTDFVANGSFASLKENVTLYTDKEEYALFIRNTDLKSGFREKVFVDKHSYGFLAKSKLIGGEVIISNVGDVGSVYLCPYLKRPMTLGNNVIMLKSNINHFLYLLFKGYEGQFLIYSITGGSAQPKFNKTDFKSLEIAIPSISVLEEFEINMKSIYEKITNNNQVIQTLTKARDTLLPKLVSGQIRVKSL